MGEAESMHGRMFNGPFAGKCLKADKVSRNTKILKKNEKESNFDGLAKNQNTIIRKVQNQDVAKLGTSFSRLFTRMKIMA